MSPQASDQAFRHARASAVIYAKNTASVSAFYAAVLGFEVSVSDEQYVVLESPPQQLVIVAIPKRIAESIEIASPPGRRENTPIKLAFFVASISVARAAAARFGGELNAPEREWQFQGFRVCDGHDPEGNVVELKGPRRA